MRPSSPGGWSGPCPTVDQLRAHLAASSPGPEAEHLVRHVEGCGVCSAALAKVLREASLAHDSHDPASDWAPVEHFERGDQLGGYVLIEPIAEGSMGRVFLALDPQLNRLVALKVITLPGASEHRARLVSRVLREARALARLTHPNVVTVYEAGEVDGYAFVAMALSRGGTLRSHLNAGAPWRETLSLLLQAGQGLCAAHGAGLVHRDFKPDNVLIREDGVAQVTDFGLARSLQTPDEPRPQVSPPAVVESSLTQTGALLGTPAYMAPETLAGGVATAASDQFSFCVTAFECLTGERPFRGDSPAALRRAIEEGQLVAVPTARVPRRIVRALTRGLSATPAQRWPSLDALLRELAPKRRGTAWVAAAVVAVAAVSAAVLPGRREAALCAQSATWDGVWGPPQRAAVERAFSASGLSFAEAAAHHVAATLDRYTSEWSEAQRQRCLAASATGHDDGGQVLLCLQQRRLDVAHLVDALGQANADFVGRAAALTSALVPPARCTLVEQAGPRQVVGPAERQRAEPLQRQLTRARLLWARGSLGDARVAAREVIGASGQLTLPSLRAEALLLLGDIERGLGHEGPDAEALFDGAIEAERAGLTATAAQGWLSLAMTVRNRPHGEPGRFLALAEVAMQRAGGPADLAAELKSQRGHLLVAQGQYTGALALQHEATTLLEATYGAGDVRVVQPLFDLATSLGMIDQCAEAEPLFRRVIAARSQALTPEHPGTLEASEALAICLHRLHRPGEAVAVFEAVLRAREAQLGPDAVALASVLGNYAGALRDLGRPDEALAFVQRSVALREKAYGPTDPRLGLPVANVGLLLASLKRDTEALAWLQRGRDLLEARGGRGLVEGGNARLQIAQCLFRLGRLAESQQELAVIESLPADQRAQLWPGVQFARGHLLLQQRRWAEAEAAFAQVLAAPLTDRVYPEYRRGAQAGLVAARAKRPVVEEKPKK